MLPIHFKGVDEDMNRTIESTYRETINLIIAERATVHKSHSMDRETMDPLLVRSLVDQLGI
jgi:hypothetical protein